MHLYVELWNAKPKWLELSAEERSEYLAQVGPAIEEMVSQGVEIVGFGINDEETPHSSGYRYLAAWRMPTIQHVETLEKAVEDAGWHDYFEQVNSRGILISPQQSIEDMLLHT